MPVSRYKGTEVVLNDLEEHMELIEARGKKFILQHRSRSFKQPSPKEMAALNMELHVWKQADRYWKLSEQWYGDPKYWWVIAQYNQKPTEAHIAIGGIVVIPTPIYQALRALGY
jgi:hypothetical protein